jgi:hypothetical protein
MRQSTSRQLTKNKDINSQLEKCQKKDNKA